MGPSVTIFYCILAWINNIEMISRANESNMGNIINTYIVLDYDIRMEMARL